MFEMVSATAHYNDYLAAQNKSKKSKKANPLGNRLEGEDLASRLDIWASVCLFRQLQPRQTLLCDYRWNYECTIIYLVARRWKNIQRYLFNLCVATRASSQLALMMVDSQKDEDFVFPKQMPEEVGWC